MGLSIRITKRDVEKHSSTGERCLWAKGLVNFEINLLDNFVVFSKSNTESLAQSILKYFRSISQSLSPRSHRYLRGRSYSRNVSSGRSRRSYARRISPRQSNRSYSRSVSARTRRSPGRGYSRSMSPRPRRSSRRSISCGSAYKHEYFGYSYCSRSYYSREVVEIVSSVGQVVRYICLISFCNLVVLIYWLQYEVLGQ